MSSENVSRDIDYRELYEKVNLEKEQLQKQVFELEDISKQKDTKIDQLYQEIDQLELLVKSTDEKVIVKDEKLQKLEKEFKCFKRQLDSLVKPIISKENVDIDIDHQMKFLQKYLINNERENMEKENRLQQAEFEIEHLIKGNQSIKDKLQALHSENGVLREYMTLSDNEMDRMTQALEDLQNEKSSLEWRLEELYGENEDHYIKLTEMQMNNNAITKQLNGDLNKLSDEYNTLKDIQKLQQLHCETLLIGLLHLKQELKKEPSNVFKYFQTNRTASNVDVVRKLLSQVQCVFTASADIVKSYGTVV